MTMNDDLEDWMLDIRDAIEAAEREKIEESDYRWRGHKFDEYLEKGYESFDIDG